ncbi:single-stranded-DNA-specific exonuclease RecJ [Halalkalibacter hemicellulosilyticus]|uniref:Single-stranded-DNA-specific exonuclease RecJ n=1 Tax=Halalkalibacter hemicellulosilyticusJCM 9152 TaxID=1236971 RepID=W4QGK4_9BACI|nr:single-stranded-DNA-specific exonuclease RecJ [Halalkalibacter hemicellulosilyticus]GAE30439.1 single-stranded-DNA-specific exonuclease RecJ [Halalkalibacter hemicellulosilyticusJCM 9152]
MLKSKARWKVETQPEERVEQLVGKLQVAPLVAKLLLNRGIETVEAAKRFLYKEEMNYHDPFLLDDMDRLVVRVKEAIEKQERILIFGDYDADGVSSTALMYIALTSLGAYVDYYIPNRFTEGYGPNEPVIRQAKEDGVDLVITVDTGIAAVDVARVAKEIELDFIITDHHEAPPQLPDALAIVNPKKPGCEYPFKGLAGVGVVLKVVQALLGRVPTEWLDIAVIGTVADLVPLIDENRLLVMEGLQTLQETSRPGLIALKKKCGLDGQVLQSDHVGFGIGPRINAAGRLDSADPAVELLLTNDSEEAEQLALEIDRLNKERKSIVATIADAAIAKVESEFPANENEVLVIAGEGWNPGVIGIVASRLVERYYRPTIVLSIDAEKGLAKGSARSIEGFDMFAELSKSRDILPHFGGHPMAAGLTMNVVDVDELRARLLQQAKESLTEEDFKPVTKVDLIATVEEVSVSVIQQMERLAPFGVNNPTPKVMLENVSLSQMRKIGSDSNHLKVLFSQAGAKLDGIGFHLGYLFEQMTHQAKVAAVGTLSINEWNGHVKPQLMLEDLAVHTWQLFDWRSAQQAKLKERLREIDEEERLLVVFQNETVDDLALHDLDVTLAHNVRTTDERYLVLLDAPKHLQQLKELLNRKGKPSRIYVVFHQKEDHFFSTQPNREQFKWFYAFLIKRATFPLNRSHDLAKHKGWSKGTVEFMIKVFCELGFATIEGESLTVVSNPEKKHLEDSASFRHRLERTKIENELIYSSYDQLKLWFEQELEYDQMKLKETV